MKRVDIMKQNKMVNKMTQGLTSFALAIVLLPSGTILSNVKTLMGGGGDCGEGCLTAEQIMEKTFTARELAGSEATVKLTLFDKQGEKWKKRGEAKVIDMKTKMYDNGKTEKKLYRFTKPADIAGTSVLMWDFKDKAEQMWIYTPANRKTTKIVSSDKSGNFMGSDFTYADMNAPVLSNYKLSIKKEEDVDGTKCWAIEVVPKAKIKEEEGYSKKMIWIGKEDFMVRKSMFWDLDGELLKVLMTRGITKVKGTDKYYIEEMSMINQQENTKSVFKTESKTSTPKIADKHFTSGELDKP